MSLRCQQNTCTAAVSVISLCLCFCLVFCLSLFIVANVCDYDYVPLFCSLFCICLQMCVTMVSAEHLHCGCISNQGNQFGSKCAHQSSSSWYFSISFCMGIPKCCICHYFAAFVFWCFTITWMYQKSNKSH